ncbi:hypothetical protein MMC27_001436 [Xylographa pallens]|nr:hypothetical protein [Xylographa pallens]
MEGSRTIWLQARIRDEPYNPELGATSGSAGRDAILPISLGMVPEDHTVNDLAGLIVKRFDTVHPDKGQVISYVSDTEYGALMSVLDPVGMHFPRRNGQEPDKPFTVLAIRFPPLPEELHTSARFTSVAPESSARPYKRSRDELQQPAASVRYGFSNMRHEYVSTNKRQRISNGGREGTFDPDRPIRSRERDLPTIDADTYRSTRQDASDYIIADSQQSPRRTHINTYGTPKSLSTASVNASASYRPQDPASVPDSPNHRGGLPNTRVLQIEHMSQDVPKSESPEQDSIVYSIPPSHPSTPRDQTASRTEELAPTFLKPSRPVARAKTPIREISNGASSSNKKKPFADRNIISEGPRLAFVGKSSTIAQKRFGVLTSANSTGGKAFSSRKPPGDVFDVVESDEEESCRMDLVPSAKPSKQQGPTAADSIPGPRLFSQINGSSTRFRSVSHNVSDNAESRRGSTTNLTNIEDLNLNRARSKIFDHALNDVSITKQTMPRAVYPALDEARVEDLQPSEQDDIQLTRPVANSLPENRSNNQQINEAFSEQGGDKTVGVIKSTVEHGMDVDVEMTLNNELEQSDTRFPDQALNTEIHMRKGTNNEQQSVKNGLEIMKEKSNAGKTWISAKTTKRTQSLNSMGHNVSQKESKEVIAAERKAKNAYKKDIERKERIRKAHELEEQQKIEVSKQDEKRCIGAPAAPRLQRMSITPPIPSLNPKRSALKSSMALRASSIPTHGTPSHNMQIDSQTPLPCSLQPSPEPVSRSVSFADTETKEAGASGKLNANDENNMKSEAEFTKAPIKSRKPVAIKDETQDRRLIIRDLVRAERGGNEKKTELEKTEHTKPIEVKTKPVKVKTGKMKPETQAELKVIRDKGKRPVYDPPSPPKPIVSHVAKGIDVGGGKLSDTFPPYLGSQPGPSKSRSSSTNVPSKDKERTVQKELSTLKGAPEMNRTPSARSISEGVMAAEQVPTDDPLLSKSASRSPAREVTSSGLSRFGSDSGSESQSDSDSEKGSHGERNTRYPILNSANESTKATSESETDSDDGELPPMKPHSRTKSPSESDSETEDEDEDDQQARKPLSIHDGTVSRSASIVDEAERQLQRESRQSMEPSRSSQIYPPPKTPRMVGLHVVAQQAKTTNLLSGGTRLPNQRLPTLSSMIKGTSSPIVIAGKKLPAYKLPSITTMVDPFPKASIDSVPVNRLGNADSQGSSEDEDDGDNDDTDDEKKGSAGKGFIALMNLAKQMDA